MIDVLIEWGRLRRFSTAIEVDGAKRFVLYQIHAALDSRSGRKSLVYIGYISEQSVEVRMNQHLSSGNVGAWVEKLGLTTDRLYVRLGDLQRYGTETESRQGTLAAVEGALIRRYRPPWNTQNMSAWYGAPNTTTNSSNWCGVPLTITNSGVVGSLSKCVTIDPDG